MSEYEFMRKENLSVRNGMAKEHKNPIIRSFFVLEPADRRKMVVVTLVQTLLGFLDLFGVALIGLLGALSISGLQSNKVGSRVESALHLLHLSTLAFSRQALILSLLAVTLLTMRTMLSVYFTRKIIYFLSFRGSTISSKLISRLLAQPLLVIQERSSQETVYAVSSGVSLIVLQVLALSCVMVSDLALLLIMLVGLLIVDPLTALGTLGIFTILAFWLNRLMGSRAMELGVQNSALSIKSNEKIVEVLSSYRESVVRNRRDYYAREIGTIRHEAAGVLAETAFMPYVSKYILESAVVIGAVLLGGSQFILQDASHAIATIAIFLTAGSRIAPAVLRIQQSSIQIRNALGAATPTLDLIDQLGIHAEEGEIDDDLHLSHDGFIAEIRLSNVSMTYPSKDEPAIRNVNLEIPEGTSVAIVGPSGAGKTTLVDIILGVIQPETGTVRISGISPAAAVARWPGAISYVPQNISAISGTVRENVAMGYPRSMASDELVQDALRGAALNEFVRSLPLALETQVGELGSKISGGQRQRLGIARAMFTKPKLLVLDEATSSLDGETEASISDSISGLKGRTTVVMIAHRLSSVRHADIVIYMADGTIIATGTFEQVRSMVKDFDSQAKLMGL
jgi:ABC-type multidrug transport system fused ATPase/permease subunit